jgi:Tfp pilus assembly protein PilE
MAEPTEPAPLSAPRWHAWLPKALFEAALIVLSVLLALAVDEWREDRQRAERAEVALRSIRAELQENLQSVERARANHLAMRDSLQTYAARGQAPPHAST